MDDTDYIALTEKIGELNRLNDKLQKVVIRQAGKIRGYKKSIRKYKDEIDMLKKQKNKNKQHYRNGRRGSMFNG